MQRVVEEVVDDSPEVQGITVAASGSREILGSSNPDWAGRSLDQLPEGRLTELLLGATDHGRFGHFLESRGRELVIMAPLGRHISGESARADHGGEGTSGAVMASGGSVDAGHRGAILLRHDRSGTEDAISSIFGRLFAVLLVAIGLIMPWPTFSSTGMFSPRSGVYAWPWRPAIPAKKPSARRVSAAMKSETSPIPSTECSTLKKPCSRKTPTN